MASRRWPEALAKVEDALAQKPGDPAALRLKARIQAAITPDWARTILSREQIEAARTAGVPPAVEVTLAPAVTMKMVFIPPGEFTMGSPADERDRNDDEGPQHKVRITRPFYLGVYEVIQAEYEAVGGNNPSRFKGAKNPVETVTWNDAVAFCEKASRLSGRKVRLPTEAEWEYACRAETKTAYQWGDDPDDGKEWCNGYDLTSKAENKFPWPHFNWRDGFAKTAPTGSFKANAWGLYDMHGNVWEWCSDWHGKYETGVQVDPKGPATGDSRVLRGGSWGTVARYCRSAVRGGNAPDYRGSHHGFRVAVDVR